MGLCLPPSLSEETLQGFKYFRLLGPLFDHLHLTATERDRARKHLLFYDQYATLLLLYFPLRAAPAAQAARHQPSVLSVPCERACAAGALAWQGLVSRARGSHGVPERGVRQGGSTRQAGRHERGHRVRATRGHGGPRGR